MASLKSSDPVSGHELDRQAEVSPEAATAADPPAEAELWRSFLAPSTDEQFFELFPALLARQIEGARQVALFRHDKGQGLSTVWPAGTSIDPIAELVGLVFADGRPMLRMGRTIGGATRIIAVPVAVDSATVAVLVTTIAAGASDPEDLAARQVRQLQWSLGWLRDRLGSGTSASLKLERDRTRRVLDVLATVLDRQGFRAATLAAVTDLAVAFGASRVSLGFRRWGASRVEAISHSSTFSRRVKLVQHISRAMDEAIDQRSLIRYPTSADELVFSTAHAELATDAKSGSIVTVPIFVVDAYEGAFVFERSGGAVFETEAMTQISAAVAAIGPLLYEKRLNDRWLIVKAWDSTIRQLRRLLGPGYMGRKLAALLVLASVATLTLWTETFHVVANAQLEPLERRAVVSAYDGYVQSAKARAGDVVKAGDELAALEDRELNLERLRWVTEKQQHQYEYDRALAARELANINVVKAQIEQAEAQIALIDEQITRTVLTSPFDGLIVKGDLTQRIGASVSRGETLFELSPLSRYRVVADVGERDIARLEPGQQGEVVFAALPDQPIAIVIDRITPVASEGQDGTGFRVEASLAGDNERLRPGMTGVARIDLDRQSVIAIWTRPFLDWLGLLWWRLVP
jgi:RND family efflux transporter MFP subunit